MTAGVYKITNIENGKSYVGSSVDVKKRIAGHKTSLRIGNNDNPRLQSDWETYGESRFVFEILVMCSHENRLMYEQKFMDATLCATEGYNICPNAGTSAGRTYGEHSKLKMSISSTGRKHTEETKLKISQAMIGNQYKLGKKPSAETKEKQRLALLGNKRLLGNTIRRGKTHTEETKAKMRLAALARIARRQSAEVPQ